MDANIRYSLERSQPDWIKRLEGSVARLGSSASAAEPVVNDGSTGLYASGGSGRVRLRETYVRDVVAPLLSRGASGAVKLDLVLRSLVWGDPSGSGVLSPDITWETLHDWCRPMGHFANSDRTLKRKWVSDKLDLLEKNGVLRRTIGGLRPSIAVLSDSMSGAPLDDPGAESAAGALDSAGDAPADGAPTGGHTYVSVLCDGFEYGRFARWEGPQIAAYLAAMIGERYARNDPLMVPLLDTRPAGAGIWFRNLGWFADLSGQRPDHHVRIPFSERTLTRGFAALRQEGLVSSTRTAMDPRTGRPFRSAHGRVVYFNGFHDLRVHRKRALTSERAMRAVLARNLFRDESDRLVTD